MKKTPLTEDELLAYDILHVELECAEADLSQAEKRKVAALEKLKPAMERGYKPQQERNKAETKDDDNEIKS